MCTSRTESSTGAVVLTVGLVAGAAAIAVLSYLYWWRVRSLDGPGGSLRSVADILSECHNKMREIQSHLASVADTPDSL